MKQDGNLHLRIGRCFSDSFHVWINHFPALAGASALAFILSAATGTLLLGSLYAGLLAMLLKAMRGEKPHVRDVFAQVSHFVRFFAITWFVLVLTTVGLALLVVPGVLIGTWCIHMYLLAADQRVTLDESFVESRKAVKRYGFWEHFILALFALVIVAVGLAVGQRIAPNGGWLVTVLIQIILHPLALGLVASAYRQTLEVESERRRQHEREFQYMRDELQTAHDMQMDLLPKDSPYLEGYTLAGICVPANTVGGDYFAYRWLDDVRSRLALVIADVSGKAMAAAITALRFNEMLRYECRGHTAPAEILDGLNGSLDGQIDVTTFITCCIAVLDTIGGAVEIANAGHCLPFHYVSRSRRVVPVQATGYPLGIPGIVRPNEPYEALRLSLEPEDALVLYSDGVVEAQNRAGELYDVGSLEDLLASAIGGADADHIIAAVVQDVQRFIGDAPRTDDLTIVVLRRNRIV